MGLKVREADKMVESLQDCPSCLIIELLLHVIPVPILKGCNHLLDDSLQYETCIELVNSPETGLIESSLALNGLLRHKHQESCHSNLIHYTCSCVVMEIVSDRGLLTEIVVKGGEDLTESHTSQ